MAKHSVFLYADETHLHFGCDNPFCGHGDPALPNHYTVPLETDGFKMTLISHRNEYLDIDVLHKETQETRRLHCPDSLFHCATAFDNLWKDTSGKER